MDQAMFNRLIKKLQAAADEAGTDPSYSIDELKDMYAQGGNEMRVREIIMCDIEWLNN